MLMPKDKKPSKDMKTTLAELSAGIESSKELCRKVRNNYDEHAFEKAQKGEDKRAEKMRSMSVCLDDMLESLEETSTILSVCQTYAELMDSFAQIETMLSDGFNFERNTDGIRKFKETLKDFKETLKNIEANLPTTSKTMSSRKRKKAKIRARRICALCPYAWMKCWNRLKKAQ